jgi:hypothetical protein
LTRTKTAVKEEVDPPKIALWQVRWLIHNSKRDPIFPSAFFFNGHFFLKVVHKRTTPNEAILKPKGILLIRQLNT